MGFTEMPKYHLSNLFLCQRGERGEEKRREEEGVRGVLNDTLGLIVRCSCVVVRHCT